MVFVDIKHHVYFTYSTYPSHFSSFASGDWCVDDILVILCAQFKKAPSSEDLPDVLKQVKFTSMAWTHDNKGIFYNVSHLVGLGSVLPFSEILVFHSSSYIIFISYQIRFFWVGGGGGGNQ